MKSKSSMFILIVVILLVVAGLVYFFVIKGSGEKDSTTQTGLVSTNNGQVTGVTASTTGNQSAGDQVVALLRNLSTIQLNGEVFQNPQFASLKDISINLAPVTNQGRRNPFAAVSTDNAILFLAPTESASTTTP